MAQAKEIIGLDCQADALEWAAVVLKVRFQEVLDLRETALDFSDIEGVHAMRVAIRRLRSALRDFLPLMNKRGGLQSVRKKLKQIADALGAVRDADVAIAALEKLAPKAENEQIKVGIEILLRERRTSRSTKQRDLTQTLSTSNLSGLQEEFTNSIDKAPRKSKKSPVISFNAAGSRAVAHSLQEFYALGTSLYDPFDVAGLHEMRIAAKRLRYAMELFTACWGKSIAPFADEIAAMQSLLGSVHDCDVWIDSLSKYLAQDQSESEDLFVRRASVWLLSNFVKMRAKNYRAALDLWSKWLENDFAVKMQTVIASLK